MVLSMAQMGNDGTLWSIDASAGLAQCYVGDGRWQANTNRKMKAVSCASAAQVWGVDANGKACVLTSSPVQSSSTSAQRLAVGGPAGPLWVYAGSITWTDSAGKTGTVPAPSVEFTSFAATDPAKGGLPCGGRRPTIRRSRRNCRRCSGMAARGRIRAAPASTLSRSGSIIRSGAILPALGPRVRASIASTARGNGRSR